MIDLETESSFVKMDFVNKILWKLPWSCFRYDLGLQTLPVKVTNTCKNLNTAILESRAELGGCLENVASEK